MKGTLQIGVVAAFFALLLMLGLAFLNAEMPARIWAQLACATAGGACIGIPIGWLIRDKEGEDDTD